MKIIDGKNAIMGRLASYAAKELLKGEEIAVINCGEIIITGNKTRIQKDFEIKAGRYGSSQKGPTLHRTSEKIVKKTIRGMLPNYREGRGRDAFKRLKCYVGVPKELEEGKPIKIAVEKRSKFSKVKEFAK